MNEIINKECSNCHQVKPVKDFYKQDGTSDGYKYSCKACNSKKSKEAYRKRTGKVGTEWWREPWFIFD